MPATLVDNSKLWENTTIQVNQVSRPTTKDYWRNTLNEEVKRQWNLSLNNFDIFCTTEYDSLAECRQALCEMYYNGLFTPTPPPKQFTFLNIKSGEKVTITENRLDVDCGTKLNLASTTVYQLINNKNKKSKSWKFVGVV